MKKGETSTLDIELINPHQVARVLGRIIVDGHEVSIYSEERSHPLSASITEIDYEKGLITLEVADTIQCIREHVSESSFFIDIKGKNNKTLELLCFDDIKYNKITNEGHSFKAIFKLPDSVFGSDQRGELRVPFIQGLQANAELEVFKKSLFLKGKVRNLSVGGCLLDLPLHESAALKTGLTLHSLAIHFPNGNTFTSEAVIRHMRPFVRSNHVHIGVSFEGMSPGVTRDLLHIVNEAEMEIAFRTGMSHRRAAPSPLFLPSEHAHKIEAIEQRARDNNPPMVVGLLEIVRQLLVVLLAIKNEKPLPEEILYDCTDTLLLMQARNRQQFLYALCCLQNEPQWLNRSLRIAGLLGDLLLSHPNSCGYAREAVTGALLQAMGKPLSLSETLPSLEAPLSDTQSKQLKRHQLILKAHLERIHWLPSPICSDVIYLSNERLDGSGYPFSKQDSEISSMARLAAVIQTLDTLTHPQKQDKELTPTEAYRLLYNQPEKYDRTWLVRYIQRHGLYPIGSLVKFSRGFLAWVMEHDDAGSPKKIRVVKNPAFKGTNLNIELTQADFKQLGQLEGVVSAKALGLVPR